VAAIRAGRLFALALPIAIEEESEQLSPGRYQWTLD